MTTFLHIILPFQESVNNWLLRCFLTSCVLLRGYFMHKRASKILLGSAGDRCCLSQYRHEEYNTGQYKGMKLEQECSRCSQIQQDYSKKNI